MGEVRCFTDRRIGRDVAVKVMTEGHPTRFLREARVQGQLEHPSIVPVYDMGIDPAGNVYFTMRRVQGKTLARVLRALSEGDEQSLADFKEHKLLSAFAQVCLAVDFAHSRGVIHRDLKPANIMLGPFGEVYVLDWGLAKVREDGDSEEVASRNAAFEHEVQIESAIGRSTDRLLLDATATAIESSTSATTSSTTSRDLMGTPGYMSPEQVRCENIDARSDVYALGVVLYEILALESFHRGRAEARMISTLAGVNLKERSREPFARPIPGALMTVIERSVQLRREERYVSARALYEAIEAYLDGTRDAEQRRLRAEAHAQAATVAVDKAVATDDREGSLRCAAMRAISGALALDPTNEEAMRALVRLVTEPPREVPKEVEDELLAEANEGRRQTSRIMPLAALAFFIGVPMAILSGVRDSAMLIVINIAWIAAIGAQLAWARWGYARHGLLTLPLWGMALALFSRVFGSYVLTSGVASAICAAFMLHNQDRKKRLLIVGALSLAIAAPQGLEHLGLIAPSYVFEDGMMIVMPRVHSISAVPMQATLFLGGILLVALPALFLGRVRDVAEDNRRRQLLTTWHLRQFLPAKAISDRASAPPPSP